MGEEGKPRKEGEQIAHDGRWTDIHDACLPCWRDPTTTSYCPSVDFISFHHGYSYYLPCLEHPIGLFGLRLSYHSYLFDTLANQERKGLRASVLGSALMQSLMQTNASKHGNQRLPIPRHSMMSWQNSTMARGYLGESNLRSAPGTRHRTSSAFGPRSRSSSMSEARTPLSRACVGRSLDISKPTVCRGCVKDVTKLAGLLHMTASPTSSSSTTSGSSIE